MKKENLLRFVPVVFLTAATLLPGCSKSDGVDEQKGPSREKIEIKATTERRTLATAEGRTSLGSNDEVLWSEADNFAVYALEPEVSTPEVFFAGERCRHNLRHLQWLSTRRFFVSGPLRPEQHPGESLSDSTCGTNLCQ